MWWSICISVRRLHVVVASMGHKRWSIDMHYCWSASRCCSKHGAQDNNDGRYACSSASRCCRANPNGSANPTIRQSRCSAMRQSRWSGRSRTTSTRSANPTSRQSRWSDRTNSSLSPNALDPLKPLELKVLRGPRASDSCILHRGSMKHVQDGVSAGRALSP